MLSGGHPDERSIIREWQDMIEIPQAPLEIILDLQKTGGNISVPAQGWLSEFSFEFRLL